MALCKLRDLGPHGLRVLGAEVRAAGVEPFVVVELLGVVACEGFEEVLSRAGPEEEQVRPDPACARLSRGTDDFLELLRPVGDPGRYCALAHTEQTET